jgi:ammonium transporter, Amt family
LKQVYSVSVIMQCFSGLAILSILWIVIGFSLSFSVNNGIIGGLEWMFMNNVPLDTPLSYAPTIPGISYASFQMMFAVITPLLITGAFADRMRFRTYNYFHCSMEYFYLLSCCTLGLGKRRMAWIIRRI